jgi:hypothetical protein
VNEYEMEATRLGNRVGIGLVLMLVAAFALSAMFALLTPIGAGADVSGNRDEDVREVAHVSDDDDDDDGDSGNGNSESNSGSQSIGSMSANTNTGSTGGTGVSRSVSNSSGGSVDTRTGTTQGTGASRSVSNSS